MNANKLNIKTMKINFLNLNSMKTSKFFMKAFLCLALVTSFTSCSDDDDNPDPIIEEELITNLTLTFTNDADAADVVIMASVAPDGFEDGVSTETVSGDFTAGATYSVAMSLLNASETPAEDVLNDDIIPEADEHFFVYAVDGLSFTMSRDADDIEGPDGSNLGVNTTWVADAASTGNLQIRLIHEPTSVDDSDEFGSATGGSEDFNITFMDVEIQ